MCNGVSFIAFRRDHGHGTFVGDLLPYLAAAIGFVGNDGEGRVPPMEESLNHLAVMGLATTDLQPKRSALVVYGDVNLTCATAA